MLRRTNSSRPGAEGAEDRDNRRPLVHFMYNRINRRRGESYITDAARRTSMSEGPDWLHHDECTEERTKLDHHEPNSTWALSSTLLGNRIKNTVGESSSAPRRWKAEKLYVTYAHEWLSGSLRNISL